jgi:hypothetical protein
MSAPREHFPRTPRTMVFEALDGGRVRDIAGELMQLYDQPLQVYYSATSFRDLGEPKDIVGGFFSSRFSQDGWLDDWRARHKSDAIPLRRWLLNSLNFYLHEEARRRVRDRRDGAAGSAADASLASAQSAESAFWREAARAIVGEALDRTREECARAGQSVHFEIFMRHFLRQTPYEQLASELGFTTVQCAGLARTVSFKFRKELASILLREGGDPHALDEEIAALLGALGP